MQSQIVCSGCRSILLYPRGASNVCCALCNAITSVPPPGMEMSQLICGGCRTWLMYTRGATNVRCSCCQTVNLAPGTTVWRLLSACRDESPLYIVISMLGLSNLISDVCSPCSPRPQPNSLYGNIRRYLNRH